MSVSASLHMRYAVGGDAREITSQDEWIVTTDPPSNADTSNPTGTAARAAGLPPLFTVGVRPDAPTLLADRYDPPRPLDEQVGTKWLVVVHYSSNGRFRFPPTKDRTNVGSKFIQDSSVRKTIEVPYFSIVINGEPQTGNQAVKYVKAVTQLDVSFANPQIRVNVNGYSSGDRETILAQLNKLHRLDQGNTGPLYRFFSFDVAEHADGLWTITYSWLGDPGTPGITITNDMVAGGIVAANAIPNSQVIANGYKGMVCATTRLPFYTYFIVPSTDTASPDIRIVRQYADPSDITGYPGAHSLPGNPV